ncbi:HAMP domain-containing sensor histidine kinase [Microbacterium testaceum]|uniref:HAMP domain-containing sensor histidine kinase n=1 Tax=Microbacterium testaceum TaxID=2033 RepID=UPI002AC7C57B|nr:HAMP domain-containing sensor histidine kinase [Microbacterium testaceum]MDZ5142995.1 HAMP domain-containing histidine kinase [Microbacterium testaceum]
MRERAPGLSVRLKLTLSYAGFVVIVGIAVFVVGFLVLRFLPEGNLYSESGIFTPRRRDLTEVFVRYARFAVGALAVVGLGGGWIVSGLMLRPLHRITDAARAVRDGDLAHRVDLPGRRDELTDLADTFDAMLARVEETLDEQRRFAANASHELRTPHATMRTLLEVARADPAGVDLERLLHRLDLTNERAIRLTEALLALARSTRGGALSPEPTGIDDLVATVLAEAEGGVAGLDLALVGASGGIARLDETLVHQAVTNLVRNALVHNVENGWVRVAVSGELDEVIVDVVNSGEELSRELVATLPEPFVRGTGRTRGRADGTGLGLAIVASIARAHRGRLELWPREGGGLHARLRLPR